MLYASPPRKINLAQLPTPLLPLDRLSEHLGGPRIWLKRDDLTGTTLTGNKVRKLEFVLARALEQGADTIITCGGVQSNHCRATALAAASLGLGCHLLLRGAAGENRDGNTLLSALTGAHLSFVEPRSYSHQLQQHLDALQQRYQQRGKCAYVIPTGASDGVGLWGYYACAAELAADFSSQGLAPDMICCATGSGGTHAGLALGCHHLGLAPIVRAYAVCDNESYFRQKVHQDIRHWFRLYFPEQEPAFPALDICDHYVGDGYGIAGKAVYETIRLVARTEGVVLDPVYTGKAFAGLLGQLKSGQLAGMNDVIFVHTGGIFGIFPFRDELTHCMNEDFIND